MNIDEKIAAIQTAVATLETSGDYNWVFLHEATGYIFWTAGDSDDPNSITKALSGLDFVQGVSVADEWAPEGWEDIEAGESRDGWISLPVETAELDWDNFDDIASTEDSDPALQDFGRVGSYGRVRKTASAEVRTLALKVENFTEGE